MAKKKLNVMDILDATEKKDSSASKVPTLDGYEKKADTLSSLISESEELESKLALVKEKMIEELRAVYLERAETPDFVKSFNLPGVKTAGIQVTFTDQFSSIDAKHKGDIQSALGKRFEEFFQESVAVSVKDQSIDSVTALIMALGKENFEKFFETKRSIKPVKGMEQLQVELPKSIQHMVKQYAPQFKRIKQ